jgi:hypothetical protein
VCVFGQSRARDLFYGLWVNDLFMKRVEANGDWSLFCPSEAPGLADVWGDKFVALYNQYEREGRAKKTIKAQQLWFAILEAQVPLSFNIYLYIGTLSSATMGGGRGMYLQPIYFYLDMFWDLKRLLLLLRLGLRKAASCLQAVIHVSNYDHPLADVDAFLAFLQCIETLTPPPHLEPGVLTNSA